MYCMCLHTCVRCMSVGMHQHPCVQERAGSCGCACICMARTGGACGDVCACRGTFAHLWGHGQAGACVGGCASLCGGCGSMCMCWGAGRMCVRAGMHMRACVRGAARVQGVCMGEPGQTCMCKGWMGMRVARVLEGGRVQDTDSGAQT